jgi:UDP-N-acetyl-D-mannosaminuronic acid dehydrogenase
MSIENLKSKIQNQQAVIGVIGLGYVGLPVACEFARAGFHVIGVDVKTDRVAKIDAGLSPIEGHEPGLAELLAEVIGSGRLRATTDYGALASADVITINVETPVDERHQPDHTALQAMCASLGKVLKENALVIVESTVAPGATNDVVRPILEEASGLTCATRNSERGTRHFFLGACPERVMPGKLLANLRGLSRVCGGSTPETAEAMVALYRQVVQADLDMTDIVTAELVKTTENAYRDVNIAFANEVAMICEAVGADVFRVRELVNKSPGRNMLFPGAGVGGHCIPKDPWLLAHSANDAANIRLITAARAVNDAMPLHIADLLLQALDDAGNHSGHHPDGRGAKPKIAVLGYAYLENSDDTRNSPSEALVGRLRELGMEVAIHDPCVEPYKGELLERVRGCDAAVLMVAHAEYRQLDLVALCLALQTPLLIDGRGLFTPSKAQDAGLIYRGVGRLRP